MKIFITGGGGFLGRYIIEDLLKDGHQITNFSRGHYPELSQMGVNCVQGSIANQKELTTAMNGHEVCFHVASMVGMWGRWDDFYQTNVVGTENVIKACRACGIKRLIYTSTPSVVFENQSLLGVDESTPYPKKFYGLYGKSKAMAEQLVLKANDQKLATCSLRPHLIWGPRDPNLTPRLVEAAKAKRIKIVGNGKNKVDVIFVENAAKAHIKAMEKLDIGSINAGKAYFIGQGPVELWPFINKLLALYQVPPLTKKIPYKLAYMVGALIEWLLKLSGNHQADPPMTRFVAMQLAKSHYFGHQNAKNDLGWTADISIDQGLKKYQEFIQQ